jgi:hypothetical protein
MPMYNTYMRAALSRNPSREMLQYVGQRIATDLYIYFGSTYSQVQGYKLY